MPCKRGDVALVPFPFSDLSATKRRPVLVLTDADAYGDFLAVGVTLRPHHSNAIALTDTDMIEGRLPVASWVRIDRVVTLIVRVGHNLWMRRQRVRRARSQGRMCPC